MKVYNSTFGGGSCAPGDAAAYWRDNASVTLSALSNNRYCADGIFTSTNLGSGTFAQWLSATSQDANSELTSDPGFIGGTTPTNVMGFCLRSDSPLLGAGTYLGAWATGYRGKDLGKPPSIGAMGLCRARAIAAERPAAATRPTH